jgi:hypothetical protein
MQCPSCGNNVIDNSAYCPRCATRLPRDSASPPEPSTSTINQATDRKSERLDAPLRKKILTFMVVVILAIAAKVAFDLLVTPNREQSQKATVDEIIESSRERAAKKLMAGEELGKVEFVLLIPNIVESTNKRLPLMVDSVTRWESFNVREGKAVYRYTLLNWTNGTHKPEQFRASVYENIRSGACKDVWSSRLLANEFVLIFSWYDAQGNHIVDLPIEGTDCRTARQPGAAEGRSTGKPAPQP